MKHRKSFSSRLYRQAQEGSILLRDLLGSTVLVKRFDLFGLGPTIRLTSRMEAEQLRDVAQQMTYEICQELQPTLTLSILMETVSRFYYDPAFSGVRTLGPVAKAVVAHAFVNQFNDSVKKLSSAICDIASACVVALLVEELSSIAMLFEAAGNTGTVDLISGRAVYSENLERTHQRLIKPYSRKGLNHRTLHDIGRILWMSPKEAVPAVIRVLKGEPPDRQAIFQNTLFEYIPGESREYWVGVLSRIIAFAHAGQVRNQNLFDPFGISIFEPMKPVSFNEEWHEEIYEYSQNQLTWRSEWVEAQRSTRASTLLVDRPIIQISNNPQFYATSMYQVGDSLNWFIEASVCGYTGGVRLPQKVFRYSLSEPFEGDVIDVFRNHSFLAGNVTDKGAWKSQNGIIPINGEIPGEIDVLAVDSVRKVAIIAECKVLALPRTPEQIRNVVGKLGDLDSERFQSKLRKKVDWLRTTDWFVKQSIHELVAIIVVDRSLPGFPISNEVEVVNEDELVSFLKKFQ